MSTVAGYGTWRSPITAEAITAGQVGLARAAARSTAAPTGSRRGRRRPGAPCWSGARPAGERQDLTPAPFNVRTRVHEYGGGAYAVRDGVIVAANFADQRLYRIDQGAAPRALTPESAGQLRYADLELDLARGRILAVREDHRAGGEAINAIVAVPLSGGDEGRILIDGHDFFSSPRLSPDRPPARLAVLGPSEHALGRHPLVVCRNCRRRRLERRAPGRGRRSGVDRRSPCGRRTTSSISSRTGATGGTSTAPIAAAPIPVCPMSAEFAGPAWAFGMRWYAFLDSGHDPRLLQRGRPRASRQDRGRGGNGSTVWRLPYTEFSGLAVARGRAILRAGAPGRAGGDHPARPGKRRRDGAVHRGRSAGRPALSGAARGDRLRERGRRDRPCLLLSADQSGLPRAAGRAAAADRQEPWRADRQHLVASCASRPSSGPRAALRCATSTTAAAPATAAPIASA